MTLRRWKRFRIRERWCLYSTGNALHATERITSNGEVFVIVSSPQSIILKNKTETEDTTVGLTEPREASWCLGGSEREAGGQAGEEGKMSRGRADGGHPAWRGQRGGKEGDAWLREHGMVRRVGAQGRLETMAPRSSWKKSERLFARWVCGAEGPLGPLM